MNAWLVDARWIQRRTPRRWWDTRGLREVPAGPLWEGGPVVDRPAALLRTSQIVETTHQPNLKTESQGARVAACRTRPRGRFIRSVRGSWRRPVPSFALYLAVLLAPVINSRAFPIQEDGPENPSKTCPAGVLPLADSSRVAPEHAAPPLHPRDRLRCEISQFMSNPSCCHNSDTYGMCRFVP
jgi:hypothetical protein